MYLSDVAPRVGVSHVAALPFSADLRWRFWLHLQAFALLCPLAAVALAPSDAQAACSPATGNNVTVSCTLATVNQGPGINTGYGDGTQNGLTLNVVAGPPPASVTGTGIGIDVNNNNTINNFGTITT